MPHHYHPICNVQRQLPENMWMAMHVQSSPLRTREPQGAHAAPPSKTCKLLYIHVAVSPRTCELQCAHGAPPPTRAASFISMEEESWHLENTKASLPPSK